jgi:Ca2+-binding EF-hand superfamily protein
MRTAASRPRIADIAHVLLQLTDQKIAMEMVLSNLGVTARTDLIQVKSLFDEVDKDGSGDIDTDELTCTPLSHETTRCVLWAP